jgi:hypothetical protein
MTRRADGVSATLIDGGAGVTIGVRGGRWRGRVTPWGAVVPRDGTATLDWSVVADDRWHDPKAEPSLRQRLIDGAPVVETAMRVPGGDALHRAYAVGTAGGLTVVEVENRSPSAFAALLSRRDVLTARRPAAVPLEHLPVSPDSLVLPVAHAGCVRVALAHDGPPGGILPAGLPSAVQVARGWVAQTSHAVSFQLPAVGPAVAVTSLRAGLLLDDPVAGGDPADFLVSVAERSRLGEPTRPWLRAVAAAASELARRHRKAQSLPWAVDAALACAREVLAHASMRDALADLDAVRRRLPPAEPTPAEPPPGVLAMAWVQRRIVVERAPGLDLFPAPFPRAWRGQPVEAHGVPVTGATLGVALRWHGDRPALLWQAGREVRLSSSGLDPSWSSAARTGEALLSAVREARP